MIVDYAENYKFVLQNSAQGAHWNNAQANVHPFACYYRPNENDEVLPLNFVVISDDLNHHTTSVHYFIKSLISFLKEKILLKKIIFMSDGAAAQYKNRFNALNLCFHLDDFGVPAEWHYFETAYGKGSSNGLAGTVKRLAARASLQLPSDQQIQTPLQLYSWAQQNIEGISFYYASQEDIAVNTKMLNRRF